MSGFYNVMIACFCSFGAWFLVGNANAQRDEEEFLDLGITEYELSCMPCHGVDGRGDGPAAGTVETRPADLTQIAKANGGIFPADRVALIIDGRAIVAMHGPRAMPIWGERYRLALPEEDPGWDAEQDAQLRIDALVDFIESLQER
jgi:hypothetical protein